MWPSYPIRIRSRGLRTAVPECLDPTVTTIGGSKSAHGLEAAVYPQKKLLSPHPEARRPRGGDSGLASSVPRLRIGPVARVATV